MREFGRAEADAVCPVSLETLNDLRGADPADFVAMIRDFSEEKSVRLALFCYNRAHLRDVSLKVASTIDPTRLAELAGTMGEVLAAQCRASGQSFGIEKVEMAKATKAKPKISLGGRG